MDVSGMSERSAHEADELLAHGSDGDGDDINDGGDTGEVIVDEDVETAEPEGESSSP